MVANTHRDKSDAREGNTRAHFLAALMLVVAGLGLMAWDDRQDRDRANPEVLVSQTR